MRRPSVKDNAMHKHDHSLPQSEGSTAGFRRLIRPKRLAQFLFGLAILIPAAAAFNLPTAPTAHALPPPPLNGAMAACDEFTLSFLGIFDITSFPEPGWVWVNPSEKTKSVSGTVKETFVTHTDFPTVHDTHDQNTHLEADPGYEGLISDVNDPGEIEMEWEIGTFNNETSGDPLERTFPRWAWPSVGDRAWFDGNWIFDCGHPTDVSGTDHYHSEIHPARALASMRDQVRKMPGTGTTPVRVTATDLYIHGRSGFVMDDLTCGQAIIVGAGSCTADPYPHRGTPIDSDYDFDVCLPPKPFASAVLATQTENGPGNNIATDPVLTPQPSTGACAGPAFGPMQVHVHVPLAGTGATPDDTLARQIYAGWIYPPNGLKHITAKLTLGDLHNDTDISPGDCECSFFWVNMDRSSDEWFRLTPFEIPTDDDSGALCLSNTNTLNDWDDDDLCGNGHLNFSGPNFDFYVVDGQDYTVRTVAYDQDCLDDRFGNHEIGATIGGVIVPNLEAVALGSCYLPTPLGFCLVPGFDACGDNDSFDAASATNLAPGSGQRVAAGSNQFELFFDVASAPVTAEDSADLSLIKACKPDLSPALAGQQFTCTVLVNNPGPGLPRNVVVRDSLLTSVDPARYTMDTPTFTFSGGGGSVACDLTTDIPGGKQFSCNAGTVPVGGSAVISYHITSQEGGDFNNFASVTTDSTDPNPNNNSGQSSVHVNSVADLSVKKNVAAGVDPVTAGTGFVYTIEAKNDGPSAATNVVVTDVVPAGMAVVSATVSDGSCAAGVPGSPFQPTRCTLGTMAPAETRIVQISVLVAPDTLGQVNNDAAISSDTLDLDNSDNVATRAITVIASADISTTKSAAPSPTVVAGTALTYTLTVSNAGPSLARNVVLTDTLPAGLSFTTFSGGGSCSILAPVPGGIVCALGNMNPGTSVIVYANTMVLSSTTAPLSNTALATSTTPDPSPLNNTSAPAVSTVLTRADLAVVKTSDKDVYKPSSQVKYTITVTNNGPSDALNVVVTDNLPDTKQAIYNFDTVGCSKAGLVLACNLGTIPSGTSTTFNVYETVRGSKGQVVNKASVASSTTDLVAANNISTRTVLIGK